jgi:hypothetical protein
MMSFTFRYKRKIIRGMIRGKIRTYPRASLLHYIKAIFGRSSRYNSRAFQENKIYSFLYYFLVYLG